MPVNSVINATTDCVEHQTNLILIGSYYLAVIKRCAFRVIDDRVSRINMQRDDYEQIEDGSLQISHSRITSPCISLA